MNMKEKWNELDKKKKILVGVGSAVAVAAVGTGVVVAIGGDVEAEPQRKVAKVNNEHDKANDDKEKLNDELMGEDKEEATEETVDVEKEETATEEVTEEKNSEENTKLAETDGKKEEKAEKKTESTKVEKKTQSATVVVKKENQSSSSNPSSSTQPSSGGQSKNSNPTTSQPKPNQSSGSQTTTEKKVVTTTKTTTATESIPFETEYQNDATLEKGKQVVAQYGQNGVRTITYKETYQDGKLVKKEQVSSTITKQPVKQIIKVGTKETINKPSLEEARAILDQTDMTRSVDGYTYTWYDEGIKSSALTVRLDSTGVRSISWNPTLYLMYQGTLEEWIENWGEEEGRINYEYAQKYRARIEKAVRAAAEAVYGRGTTQANALYSEIINTRKVFTKSF